MRHLWTSTILTVGALASTGTACADSRTEIVAEADSKAQLASLKANINNILVIYLENRSFDSLFGTYPGANGLANASSMAKTQLQLNADGTLGAPYPVLPDVYNIDGATYSNVDGVTVTTPNELSACSQPPSYSQASPLDETQGYKASNCTIAPLFPQSLANGPWEIRSATGQTGNYPNYQPLQDISGDLVHRYYQEQVQINHGAMNLFVAGSQYSNGASPVTSAGGLVMSYNGQADMSTTHIWKYAQQYTLADNYFHGAFGGSFLNHSWLVCACAFTVDPVKNLNASGSLSWATTILGANGLPLDTADNQADTTGKYWVNTSYSVYLNPETAGYKQVQPQTLPHIGDRLQAAGLSWKWYGDGLTAALTASYNYTNNTSYTVTDAGGNSFGGSATSPAAQIAALSANNFQWHHHPMSYFADQAPTVVNGQLVLSPHLKDRADLINDIQNGTLPNVAFYKPIGDNNMHPGYANISNGDDEVYAIVSAVQANPSLWAHTLIIVTFDEHGGRWDHVAPPIRDAWGPGSRVPALLISPWVRSGYIDHTAYDTTSILSTIEARWNLTPLNQADAKAAVFSAAFK